LLKIKLFYLKNFLIVFNCRSFLIVRITKALKLLGWLNPKQSFLLPKKGENKVFYYPKQSFLLQHNKKT